MICKRCGKIYVGETYRILGDRFAEHRRNVKNAKKTKSDCPVALHFSQRDHCVNDMLVTVLVAVDCAKDNRQFLEQRIIHHLGTLRPRGINVKGIRN